MRQPLRFGLPRLFRRLRSYRQMLFLRHTGSFDLGSKTCLGLTLGLCLCSLLCLGFCLNFPLDLRLAFQLCLSGRFQLL